MSVERKREDESRHGIGPDQRHKKQKGLAKLVEELCSDSNSPGWRKLRRYSLPSRDAAVDIIETIRSLLFPGYFGASTLTKNNIRFHIGSTLDKVKRILEEQIERCLCFVCSNDMEHCPECGKRAVSFTDAFIAKLPSIRSLLEADVQASYVGDPAATSPDETIFCYPGVLAVINYRLAHELHVLGVPLLPRMITEYAHSITGIDIHPGASIGESFFIDHGTGVVIGETCIIGKKVRIYQGVTLGAKSFPLDEEGKPIKGIKRHPIVEDEVVIYSGATILGRVVIGRGSVIGGNVWLTRSVPPFSRITQRSARRESFEGGSGI